jgi:hypothetical protein
MAKTEMTSKAVASKAAKLMKVLDRAITDQHIVISCAQGTIRVLEAAKSVAASGLTQAPDRAKSGTEDEEGS